MAQLKPYIRLGGVYNPIMQADPRDRSKTLPKKTGVKLLKKRGVVQRAKLRSKINPLYRIIEGHPRKVPGWQNKNLGI